MACSAIYFLDMKGKVLMYRNYRGDIENTVIEKFIGWCFAIRELRPDHKSDAFVFSWLVTNPKLQKNRFS